MYGKLSNSTFIFVTNFLYKHDLSSNYLTNFDTCQALEMSKKANIVRMESVVPRTFSTCVRVPVDN
ncbi:chaperone protein dnaJ 6 [Iris pallida]|uniref:Chaperone protein dnaJ 6 n=1 Tax=Iris pallida TaxID=29817 RepID=A0AAX6H897_IRIPA|nr:chaperone protein dnaJ 6 [Iris pallida]